MVTAVTAALKVHLERDPLRFTERTGDRQLPSPVGDVVGERVEMQVDVGVRLSPLATTMGGTQGLAA